MNNLSYINKIKNQELFLSRNKKLYFEGWYFKNSFLDKDLVISFIPGICKNKNENYCFIQVICNKFNSFFIKYDISKFKYFDNPFKIKIDNNIFSKEKIYIDITYENIHIECDLKFSNMIKLKTSIYTPNIMGPFAYLTFLDCNHGIVSLNHNITGEINITNNNNLIINNKNLKGNGYIEKDLGISFPKEYYWCHCNDFTATNTSLFIAIADIPFKLFSFTGHIACLLYNNNQYLFTTYNLSKYCYNLKENTLKIELKKKKYLLKITININNNFKLVSPNKSKMNNIIFESLDSNIKLEFYINNKLVLTDNSNYCSVEVVK